MKISRQKLRRMILEAMSLSEHRISPGVLDLPGAHPSEITDIYILIKDGHLDHAQARIDAYGGPPNYARDYAAYQEVGDMEKLGNIAYAQRTNPTNPYILNAVDKAAGDKASSKAIEYEDGQEYYNPDAEQSARERYSRLRNRKNQSTLFDDPLNEHNSNRDGLRRMILNELMLLQDNTMKVVELSLGSAFFLRHPELQGGEIVVDEMDEVAGALVALKGMGFTHVLSLETGDEPEPIGATIQYFDEGGFQYAEHYGDVSHDALVDDMDMDFGGSYDEDSEDDDWI